MHSKAMARSGFIVLLVLLAGQQMAAQQNRVPESAREIPVACEADVLVAGGSVGGIAAAITAARAGQSVAIITPCPFFDEEIAATGRYWLADDDLELDALGREMFEGSLVDVEEPEGYRHIHPARFKKRLDSLVAGHRNITVFFQSHVTDLLRDASGKLAGACISNKAGRQAVLAKVIIDATSMAGVARLAGADMHPWPDQAPLRVSQTMTWDSATGESQGRRVLEFQLPDEIRPAVLREYVLDIKLTGPAWPQRCRAAQEMRREYAKDKAKWSGHAIHMVEPVGIRSRSEDQGSPWPGPEKMPLDACRPVGLDRLYVLGSACDVARSSAARLVRPPALIRLGRRIGERVAGEAADLEAPNVAEVTVAVGPAVDGSASTLDTREALGPAEPLNPGPRVLQGHSSLPVWGRYDVVVVGGGTAGAPAAIAAARAGARTLVIEMSGVLGGVGSNGIGWLFMGYRNGFAAEFVKAAHPNFRAAHGKDYPGKRGDDRDRPFMFPLQRSYWLMGLLSQAGADVWFTTMGTGTVNEGNRVRGVVVSSPMGRGVVLAKRVIDATGDGDISVAAGADYRLVSPTSHYLQHAGYTGDHAIVDGFRNDNTAPMDPAHVAAVTWFLRKNRSRNTHKDLYDFYYQLLFRETRRIVCDTTITYLDQVLGRRYADTIAVTRSSFDKHGEASSVYRNIRLRTDRNELQSTPYRALLPKGTQGLIVTGRCRSTTSDALPKTRMQSDMMNEGYAAGRCAAYSAMNNRALREIDLSAIQEHLLQIGAIPDKSFLVGTPTPSDDQLTQAAADPHRHNAATLLAWPERARPVLKASFADDPTPRKAHLLCLLGDKDPLPFLLGHLESDAELHERLRTVWALGELRDLRATTAITDYLGLPPVRHGKHRDDPTRAAAVALGKIGDKRAIPELQAAFEKLKKHRRDEEPGVSIAIALHACGQDMSSYFKDVIRGSDKLAARRVALFLAGPAGTEVPAEHDADKDE